MIPTERTRISRRIYLPIAAAVAVAALTAAVDGARAQSQPGALSGFILDRGRYITIAAPRAGDEPVPIGINDHGQIVGEYIVDSNRESGFIRDQRGRINRFLVPGARGTEATDINNRGQIVGTYSDDTPIVNDSARPRAFLLDRGRLTRIDVPGAAITAASGVNDRGQVVGGYRDARGRSHGYLWEKGKITTIDVPGSVATDLGDINNRGQIVGVYGDDPNAPTGMTGVHGFLLSRGDFTTFDAPGVPFTQPSGLNDRGQIVGTLVSDPDLTEVHGFLLAKGAKRRFTPIDFPGAPRTAVFDINNRGQIVGIYENARVTAGRQRTPMRMPMTMMSDH
jgi:probable HAF family extracellular repeat protein